MINNKNTIIGGFVLSAIVLLVITILLFGGGKFFKEVSRFVVYLPGSVQGLRIGSPVTLKGARVGEVVEMRVVYDPNRKTTVIPVVLEFVKGSIQGLSISSSREEAQEAILRHGIRAQLSIDSFVTGQKSVALDFRPEKQAIMSGLEAPYPEIPSIESPLDGLSKKLENVPLEDIMRTLQSSLAAIDKILNSPSVQEASSELSGFIKDGREFISALDTKLNGFNAGALSNNLEGLVKSAKALTEKVDDLFSSSGPTFHNLNEALDELGHAALAFREFSDYLKRHPEAILKGKQETGGLR